jgi:hypothetical protein
VMVNVNFIKYYTCFYTNLLAPYFDHSLIDAVSLKKLLNRDDYRYYSRLMLQFISKLKNRGEGDDLMLNYTHVLPSISLNSKGINVIDRIN